MTKRIQRLQPGDKIALICPGARCLSVEPLQQLQHFFADKGFEAVYGPECTEYLEPADKAKILMDYLQDDSIKLLWAVRGGERCADLIPYLEQYKAQLQQLTPKGLIGFSDITVLLNYFAWQVGWPVVHGMGALQFTACTTPVDAITQQLTWQALCDGMPYVIPDCQAINVAAKQAKDIDGVCCGGTLSLLNIAVGDAWQFSTKNKIVIIEDVGEGVHAVSRTLKYLQRIGFFAGAAAVVFGNFAVKPLGDTVDKQQRYREDMRRYLGYFAESCDFPVFLTDKFGHGQQNYPVIFNVPARMHHHCLEFADYAA